MNIGVRFSGLGSATEKELADFLRSRFIFENGEIATTIAAWVAQGRPINVFGSNVTATELEDLGVSYDMLGLVQSQNHTVFSAVDFKLELSGGNSPLLILEPTEYAVIEGNAIDDYMWAVKHKLIKVFDGTVMLLRRIFGDEFSDEFA